MQTPESAALVVAPAARTFAPVPDGPLLSNAAGELLREIPAVDEVGVRRLVQVPIERPLTVHVDGREVVTLMTLGAAPEWLVIGYLRNQQMISDVSTLESISVDWPSCTVSLQPHQDLQGPDFKRLHPLGGAGCNVEAGFSTLMSDLTALKFPATGLPRVAPTALTSMLRCLREHDSVFRVAGSVHGCALFCGADLWLSVEDVSRRNAIDTVCGWMVLHGIHGTDKMLFTSGRVTAETVIKAAINGIPVIVSRKGLTGMGFELAEQLGMTLLGRAADHTYLCYAGADRLDPAISRR
jgi:FdhD protein